MATMNQMSYSEPILPLELERIIFESCATSLPVFIPQLMLVAYRVKEWVEPILYCVICIGLDSPVPSFPHLKPEAISFIMNKKSPDFLRNTVRHFMVENDLGATGKQLLELCPTVQSLSIPFEGEEWDPIIVILPLRRLDVDFRQFLRLPPTCAAFSCLTHLFLNGSPPNEKAACMALMALPKLTHLSLNCTRLFVLTNSHRILHSLPSLCVLVIFGSGVWHWRKVLQLPTRDLRFVMIIPAPDFTQDWHSGAGGGTDYWSTAGNFVAKRRAGEIDPLTYVCDAYKESEYSNLAELNLQRLG
ncbi:hypothetical protein R3P38DRAFT_2857187 [Favolaschia claudopus]|uniref:Uncharacterized protein n=1 Tax=Favolaschia claudopus TaxID=2862362 RepID=A0AAW0DLZ0_9AGAR